MHPKPIAPFLRPGRCSLWPVFSASAVALALLISPAAAQKPPGLPSPVNPPPGAPAPQPAQPAGADQAAGEGLIVEPEQPRTTGRIVQIEDNRITIETNDTNEKMTFAVDSEGEIVLNKEPAELRDLRPGDFVRLTLTNGENPEAELVWAARVKDKPEQPDQTFPPEAFDDFPRGGRGRARTAGGPGGLGVVVSNTPGFGALVAGVRSGTPAAEAGLAAGDFILALDNARIGSGQELLQRVQQHRAGDVVLLTVWRVGQVGTTGAVGAPFGTTTFGAETTTGDSTDGNPTNGDQTGEQTGQPTGGTQPQSRRPPGTQAGEQPQGSPTQPSGVPAPLTTPPRRTQSTGRDAQASAERPNVPQPRPRDVFLPVESRPIALLQQQAGGNQAQGQNQTSPAAQQQNQTGTATTDDGFGSQIGTGDDFGSQIGTQPQFGTQIGAAENDGVGSASDTTLDPTTSGFGAPVAPTTGGNQFTARARLTTAQQAQDAVVNSLQNAPIGQGGFVNGIGSVPVGGIAPFGVNPFGVSPFVSTDGTTDGQFNGAADQPIAQSLQQLRQELQTLRQEIQTLRQEIFQLHGQQVPNQVPSQGPNQVPPAGQPQPFPMTTPPGSLPSTGPSATPNTSDPTPGQPRTPSARPATPSAQPAARPNRPRNQGTPQPAQPGPGSRPAPRPGSSGAGDRGR
jgi:hypothetical protein